MSYINKALSTPTPQTEPISPKQVKNNAGGYVFSIGPLEQVKRFLILGTEGGTYYCDERRHTLQAFDALKKALTSSPLEVLAEVVRVLSHNLALKPDPAIFTYAMLASHPEAAVRKAALEQMSAVVKTGGQMLMLMSFLKGKRGWGQLLKRAVAGWYLAQNPHNLMLQLIKYANRNGWTQRDVLRLAKPKPEHDWQSNAFAFAVGKPRHNEVKWCDGEDAEVERMVNAFQALKAAKSAAEAATVIRKSRLPHEALLSEHRNSREVWEALLEGMPYHALLRNLSTLSRLGVLDAPDALIKVTSKLKNPKGSKVHPMRILLALHAYKAGRSEGGHTWTTKPSVIAALSDAFPLAFKEVTPMGKRVLVGLDVSGSMSSPVLGMAQINARKACCALATVWANTEPSVSVRAFSSAEHGFPEVDVVGRRLDDVYAASEKLAYMYSRTDCSLPMQWAMHQKEVYDVFVVLTDNETYAGNVHPAIALEMYRQQRNPNAKMVVLATSATDFSIAQPGNPAMLDVAGFSADVPQVVHGFVTGG